MVINDYGLARRDRTTKSGAVKSRYTVSIKSEPILVGVDPRTLTKAPAEAIAEHFRKSIAAISEQASQATLKRRASAARNQDKAWVSQRYAGGRIGAMPPNQSDRLFNDSGRLVKSIAVGATKDGWTVNVAANRFDSRTATEAAIVRMFEMLKARVPGWGDPRELYNVLSVRRAIDKSMSDRIKKATERNLDLQIQRLRAAVGLVTSLAG